VIEITVDASMRREAAMTRRFVESSTSRDASRARATSSRAVRTLELKSGTNCIL